MSRKSRTENEFVEQATAAGWTCDKTHGGLYAPGWPDFYCIHAEHGTRWVEMKKGSDRLTMAQHGRFTRWRAKNVKIWVLRMPDPRQLLDEEGVRYCDILIAKGPKLSRSKKVDGWIEGKP